MYVEGHEHHGSPRDFLSNLLLACIGFLWASWI